MQIMLASIAVTALVTGYALGSFQIMMFIYLGGVALITVPNWPLFSCHPLNWLDITEAEKHPKPQSPSSDSNKKTTKK